MAYKVLIIDDSDLTRILLAEFLEGLGHSVVAEAATGREGLERFREFSPELTTLDISMPDMHGFQVLDEIRAASPQARVVLVTGNDQDRSIAMASARRAPLLAKPFTPESLAEAIARAESMASGGGA